MPATRDDKTWADLDRLSGEPLPRPGLRRTQARVVRIVVGIAMTVFAATDAHGADLRSSGAVALVPLVFFVLALQQDVDKWSGGLLPLAHGFLAFLTLFLAFAVARATDGDPVPTIGLAVPPIVLAAYLGERARRRWVRTRDLVEADRA